MLSLFLLFSAANISHRHFVLAQILGLPRLGEPENNQAFAVSRCSAQEYERARIMP
jgi:hypothetical protein